MDLYELRVRGDLEARARNELNPISETELPAAVVLICEARDQAEVHGLIARVAECGLELLEIRRCPDVSEAGQEPAEQPGD